MAIVGDGERSPCGQMSLVFGAGRDLDEKVRTHLFIISPNHSGSSFLRLALATCRGTWNLRREGREAFVFPKPRPSLVPGLPRQGKFWALGRRRLNRLADPSLYDWPRIRKAWHFLAYARCPSASVFVVQSPRHLFQLGMLTQHFRNAKFLFMVRNPYATCEGICRVYRRKYPEEGRLRISLEEWAARHFANCLAQQRRNLEEFGDRGVFFTYEAMCEEPELVARSIQALVPELDDLELRRRLPVRGGAYNEMLTNMNARQVVRLDAAQIAAMNKVFRAQRELLDHFGYELMEAPQEAPLGGLP